MLNDDEIVVRHEKLMTYVGEDSRAEKITKMYETFGDQMILSPASGKYFYHNAFPGGYVDHVVRVVELVLKQTKLYKEMGGDVDYTRQECIFAALNHDLGKLGSETNPYYIEQDSDWHRKRGELFKHNPELEYMKVPDRALFMLQKHGIEITQKEWLAIKLSDGIYDEANKSYLINYIPYPLKTVLPRIVHIADYMASQIENDKTRF